MVDSTNLPEVDINAIATDLNGKADVDYTNCSYLPMRNDVVHIIETYQNGSSWYKVYSDGWCEQGGYKTGGSNTVTLLKKYKDTNYGVLAYVNIKTTGEAYNFCWSGTKTVSTFTIGGNAGTLNDAWIISTAGTIYWKTEGYIA